MTVTVSEEVQAKASAALLGGKVEVKHRTVVNGRERLEATCVASRGGRRYKLYADEQGAIRCDCEARGLCHHILGVGFVTGRAPKAMA